MMVVSGAKRTDFISSLLCFDQVPREVLATSACSPLIVPHILDAQRAAGKSCSKIPPRPHDRAVHPPHLAFANLEWALQQPQQHSHSCETFHALLCGLCQPPRSSCSFQATSGAPAVVQSSSSPSLTTLGLPGAMQGLPRTCSLLPSGDSSVLPSSTASSSSSGSLILSTSISPVVSVMLLLPRLSVKTLTSTEPMGEHSRTLLPQRVPISSCILKLLTRF